ncbi:TetR/AcrR family transcriptional regulator [Psychrobium sp. 1_MG-2023]|uniref:TetR/AcrR family transcriptional regulator n=1 Tax=Psychrobium sp. 1_MG-2023 TaxID=3062624 RepID=UPI000C3470E8|nr:TetR/AcrR family transcriptional regulator [Psychrobium sp. 1_MG-2023]MDP2562529.1 TetR/AcrR family transcriptional regulator [Psychrobium sp. 1_MG-2023]PKF57979.1 TetR family transcriptional regulator [Alteromonadales bacterium alter-6D02]
MKTKDKIIQGSIELFNLQGERNVTTNHIAAHVGISPGNLYYHYRNKDDIIRSIYKLYEKNLAQMFQPRDSSSVGMDEMLFYIDRVFYSMWQFRFFYANLPDILARDDVLHQRYLEAQKALNQRMVGILKEMRGQGYTTIEDEMIEDLAHTLKLVVTFWISYQHTQTQQEITKATISDGVLKVIGIFKGYLTPSGLEAISKIESDYKESVEAQSIGTHLD